MKSERLQIQEKRFNELKINREGLPTQGQGKEQDRQQVSGGSWTLRGEGAGLPLRQKAGA